MHIVGDSKTYRPGRLRMAFGACSAKANSSRNLLILHMCENVVETVSRLKALSVSQLRELPVIENTEVSFHGHKYLLAVFRDDNESGQSMLVVRSYHRTFWFPNIISNYEIGKIYVEGILIGKDGVLSDLSDEDLWRYR